MSQQKKTSKHLGSSLDDFLAEEGLLVEVTAVAQMRVEEAVLQRSYAAQKGVTTRFAQNCTLSEI